MGYQYKFNNIYDGVDEYLIYEIFKKNKKLFVILKDERELVRVSENLKIIDSDIQILEFPAWDTFPFDKISPNKSLVGKRVFTLNKLLNDVNNIIILSTVSSVVQKLPPKVFFEDSSLKLFVNQEINFSSIVNYLNKNSYLRTSTVREIGEFAYRGSIIDVFPVGHDHPKRIDLFGNILESIKIFDPIDQKSISETQSLEIHTGNEFIYNPESINTFRKKYRKIFKNNGLNDELYSSVSSLISVPGIEQYLFLFYENLSNIFNYIDDFKIFTGKGFNKFLTEKCEEINDLYLSRKLDYNQSKHKLIPIEEMYLSQNMIKEELKLKTVFNINFTTNFIDSEKNLFNYQLKAGIDLFSDRSKGISPLETIINQIKNEKKVVFIANTNGSLNRIIKLIKDASKNEIILSLLNSNPFNSPNKFSACIYRVSKGFRLNDTLFISEEDIFGLKYSKPRTKNKKSDNFIRDITSLQLSDYLVHIEHGICKFEGLETIKSNNIEHDCLKLSFYGGDVLFLPVENIELISKYGSESQVQLDRLGGASWQERKAFAKKRIREIANLLINTAAERTALKGNIISYNQLSYEEFCSGFEFDETEDQLNAIKDVENDLSSNEIMDRLICGDVGYGKTEIALRAAFLVAMSGFQVAVIAPTTLLVRQHYENFVKRYKSFPIKVMFLSRFIKGNSLKITKESISNGEAQIIIGTQSLLSKNIHFNNLGLLIIDEEQHFGVNQKEFFKQKYKKINILSLTATPIPRTLQLSLSGIVNMSLITTPPANRLSIRTFISPWDEIIIKEAIKRELFRGGSIFFVVPRINDIAKMHQQLLNILPNLKISVAHGQMKPKDIEKAISEFIEGDINLLLTTNIIESGLDIKSANTIIIYRADMFGLSQLYQLRGRVGRSSNRAYAYLTISSNENISEMARKRLNVMQTLDSLGAGFSLASHDMDIRGAGNLLGQEQSGNIREVGVELYQKLLNEAVSSEKNKDKDIEEDWSIQIKLSIPTKIPEEYINDLSLRLSFYKRISYLRNDEEIDEMILELEDRFGKLPFNVMNLLEIISIKIKCKIIKIKHLELGKKGILIKFKHEEILNPEKLIEYFSNIENAYFRHDNSVIIKLNFNDQKNKIKIIKNFLDKLVNKLSI